MTLNETNYRWKNIAVMLTILAVSLGIMAVKSYFPALEHFLSSLSESLFVGGLLGFIFEILLRKDILKMIHEMQQTIDANKRWGDVSKSLGLRNIHKSDRELDTRALVKDAVRLTLVMNDGRTWLSTHEADFEERMSKSQTETTVYLVHPESEYLNILSKKVGSSVEVLRTKIFESIDLLRRLATNGHTLRIYGHFLPATYSLIHTEKCSCQILYPIGRKMDQVPVYVYEKGEELGFYDAIVRDMGVVHTHARELYPNKQMM